MGSLSWWGKWKYDEYGSLVAYLLCHLTQFMELNTHQENKWVLIGQKYNNPLTTCMTHEQLEGGPPDWGLTDANPSAKQHLLCCLDTA